MILCKMIITHMSVVDNVNPLSQITYYVFRSTLIFFQKCTMLHADMFVKKRFI